MIYARRQLLNAVAPCGLIPVPCFRCDEARTAGHDG
jgi:hypothetical protein